MRIRGLHHRASLQLPGGELREVLQGAQVGTPALPILPGQRCMPQPFHRILPRISIAASRLEPVTTGSVNVSPQVVSDFSSEALTAFLKEVQCTVESCFTYWVSTLYKWFRVTNETAACSLEGMVDVKSRRCAAEGCNKYPAFNVPGENTARYCGDHRQQGMIDVHNKRCNTEGCIKRPTFNYPGAGHLPLTFCVSSGPSPYRPIPRACCPFMPGMCFGYHLSMHLLLPSPHG